LGVEARWNTGLQAIHGNWWLDPKGKEFGDNARFFKRDIAEAKKLLTAAGYANGFETTSSYVTGPELPTAKHAEVIDAMIGEIGIKSRVVGLDYQTQYIPKFRDAKGQFEGWAYKSTAGGSGTFDPVSELSTFWWSKGGTTFHGFSTNGRNDMSGDPQIDSLIEKARLERDTEKRRTLVYDVQRSLAKSVFALYPPGSATGFSVAWPCLANFRVYQGGRLNDHLWVDDTKAPFKKA
jgi:ABC-type transport system substrate-binding protein